jgi:MFS transporter, DHA1 family, multidrug resistance protein
MGCDVIRDSFFGQVVYYVSAGRLFRHPEDMPGFVLPEKYARLINTGRDSETSSQSNASTLTPRDSTIIAVQESPKDSRRPSLDEKTQVKVQEKNTPNASGEVVSQGVVDVADAASTKQTMTPLAMSVADPEKGIIVQVQQREIEEELQDPFIVDWYSPNDRENARNVCTVFTL